METISSHSGIRWVRDWLETALSFLFPKRCSGCGQPGSAFCTACSQSIVRIVPPVCAACGKPLTVPSRCGDCRDRLPPLRARSYALYQGPLASAVLHLKYRPSQDLAEQMGAWLAELYGSLSWQATLIVPVPLSGRRMRQRGYNQASLVASALARSIGVPHHEDALHRTRDTRSQVGLDPGDRTRNVHQAFEGSRELVGGKTVLVVDDLWTTGATLISCAEALLSSGATSVLGLTVARARADRGR